MYICIYIYEYINVCTCTSLSLALSIFIYVYIYIYIYIYECGDIYIYIYIYIYVYVHIHIDLDNHGPIVVLRPKMCQSWAHHGPNMGPRNQGATIIVAHYCLPPRQLHGSCGTRCIPFPFVDFLIYIYIYICIYMCVHLDTYIHISTCGYIYIYTRPLLHT
jgi:hypothetical protein